MSTLKCLLPVAAVLIMFVPGCFCRASGNVESEDYDTELAAWRLDADERGTET